MNPLSLLFILILVVGCGIGEKTAGTGVETTNGFSGLVTDSLMAPIYNAKVTYRPVDFLLGEPSSIPSFKGDTGSVLTDINGNFLIGDIPSGTYLLDIRLGDSLAARAKYTVNSGDTLNTDSHILTPTGELEVFLALKDSSETFYVQIYGMDVRAAGRGTQPIVITGLAEGDYQLKVTTLSQNKVREIDSISILPFSRTKVEVDDANNVIDVHTPSRFARDSALVHEFLEKSGALKSTTWDSAVHRRGDVITGIFLGGIPLDSVSESIGNLKFIDSLWLNRTSTLVLPATLYSLTQLLSLNLSYNSGLTLSNEFYSLTSLEHINLSGLNYSNIDTLLLSFLNLKNLLFADNQITLIPETISTSGLENLDLANNELDSLPISLFQMTGLRSLGLSGNRLTTLPDVFSTSHILEKLFLEDNLLQDLPQSFTALPNLQVIRLNGNNLCTVPQNIQTFLDNVPDTDDWSNSQLGC